MGANHSEQGQDRGLKAVEGLRKDLATLRIVKGYPELLKRNQELQTRNAVLAKESTQLKETLSLVEGKEMTLKDLRRAVAKIKADEIEQGAQTLFIAQKADWEKSEKRKEVFLRACDAMTTIIDELRKPPDQRKYGTAYQELDLPQKIEDMIKAEVSLRVKEEIPRKEPKTVKAESKNEQAVGRYSVSGLTPGVVGGPRP
jgi:hypothetical protein